MLKRQANKHQGSCRGVIGLILLMTLVGCHLNDPADPASPESTPFSTPAAGFLSLTPTSAPVIDQTPTLTPDLSGEGAADGWQELAPGLVWRTDLVGGNFTAQIVGIRIDPAHYTFRVHYRPGDPLTLSGWQEALPEAVAFVNASFFDHDQQALGLVIADGVSYGSSLINLGGTFAILNGQPLLRSNITDPYQGQLYEQAVQAFPMLVNGSQSVFDGTQRDEITRRTSVGIDSSGQVMLLATPLLGLRLTDLSTFLANDPYRLSQALNLDGGGSTMLWIRPLDYSLRSFDAVPAVLAVYERET